MEKSVVSIVKAPNTPDAKEMDQMIRKAIDLIGGMKKFVSPGDTVVIKGNFFAPYPPPVIVDRRTVAALVRQLYEAGAGQVTLCEAVSVGTKLGRGQSTAYVLDEMGVRDEAEKAGARVVCLEDEERIQVSIPDGKCIGQVAYPKLMYDCDVLIDLPCMKTHGMTLVTLGMKNFQGILNDEEKYYAHRDDFEQKIVDLFKIRKPDLTLIDGITAMEGNGAGEGGLPHPMNLYIASADVVAADSVAIACMGIEDVFSVAFNRIADYDAVGNGKLENIDVVGSQIDEVKEEFLLPDAYRYPDDRMVTGTYQNIDFRIGGACKQCWNMAGGMGRMLSKIPQERFTVLVGSDPKLPNGITTPLENVIVLGDCACAATGCIKELRNKMLLEEKGVMAPGCPPYRPATAIVERYLTQRGLLNKEAGKAGAQKKTQQFFDYYKKIDPTWKPKSEQKKTETEEDAT